MKKLVILSVLSLSLSSVTIFAANPAFLQAPAVQSALPAGISSVVNASQASAVAQQLAQSAAVIPGIQSNQPNVFVDLLKVSEVQEGAILSIAVLKGISEGTISPKSGVNSDLLEKLISAQISLMQSLKDKKLESRDNRLFISGTRNKTALLGSSVVLKILDGSLLASMTNLTEGTTDTATIENLVNLANKFSEEINKGRSIAEAYQTAAKAVMNAEFNGDVDKFTTQLNDCLKSLLGS